MKKRFAVSLCCVRPSAINTHLPAVHHTVGILFGDHVEEARTAGIKHFKETHPESDGWIQHDALFLEIPDRPIIKPQETDIW